jgi:hypothetical protein
MKKIWILNFVIASIILYGCDKPVVLKLEAYPEIENYSVTYSIT